MARGRRVARVVEAAIVGGVVLVQRVARGARHLVQDDVARLVRAAAAAASQGGVLRVELLERRGVLARGVELRGERVVLRAQRVVLRAQRRARRAVARGRSRPRRAPRRKQAVRSRGSRA